VGRLHLGSILGTKIAIDFSFIILIAFFVVTDINRYGVRYALLWAPVIFISILFHELAHAAMIGIFGFGPSQIVLAGMGGATMNERKARPWQDMLISGAGPASSFLLAWLLMQASQNFQAMQRDPFLVALVPFLIYINILWGEFNLLPVMPLDGSGVLRNFLRMFLEERLAFVIAVWVSMIAGVAVAIWAMTTKNLLLIFLMLWFVRDSWVQWDLYRSFNRPS
jgi:Zn-dependent protease